MYNRYRDIHKFITDTSQLQIINNNEVYISEEDYDVAIVLEENQVERFEDLKTFIICIANYICEVDNHVQAFYRQHSQTEYFPYDLEVIYIHEEYTNKIELDYWGTEENTQFSVECAYENDKFAIKKIGSYEFN